MKKPLFLLVFALIISCQEQHDDNSGYAFDAESQRQITSTPISLQKTSNSSLVPVEQQEVVKKRIIKDGRLGIQVNEIEIAKTRIDTLVKKFSGYYSNESFNNSDWESSYVLKIRIPSARFESFLKDLESGDGEIQHKTIDARDVTDQFIDLETRLESKKAYLKRYMELLKRAQTIKEILQIEEKIRGLQEEIESTLGRLKYLGDLVDYSTLDLTITEKKDFQYDPVQRDKFAEKFKQSLSKGWFGFIDALLFTIKIWPLWIIGGLGIFFLKRRKKNKKTS